MFSINQQQAPRGSRRAPSTRLGSVRLASAGSSARSAPAPIPAHRAVLPSSSTIGSFAVPTRVSSGRSFAESGSVNEDQQATLSRELKKAEDRGGVKSLVKDEVHAVTLFGTLPPDVQHLVQESAVGDQVRATVDYVTGFAVVWSQKTCYVWNCTRRAASAPTCYAFPCPDPAPKPSLLLDTLASLPLAALLPHGASSTRDPGLLLISPSGSLRLWDSLSLSLSGVEKFQAVQIPLNSGEYVRCLEPLGPPSSFVIGTSESRLFRVAVFAGVGGKPTVLTSAMSRGWKGLASVGQLFKPTFATDRKTGILAIATAPSGGGGYDLWALERENVQRWRVNAAGGEQLVHEGDVKQAVLESLVASAVDLSLAARMQLQYLDLKAASESQLCLLVSYVNPSLSDPPTASTPRSFALLTLDPSLATTSPPIISSISKLSHRSAPDPRPGTSALLALSPSTSAAFVILGDAVIATSREGGAIFEEVVGLKESIVNRVIGFGHQRTIPPAGAAVVVPQITVITTASGLLRIEVNPQALVRQGVHRSAEAIANQQTAKLKTKLDQAIYYGDDVENPVSFKLGTDYQGDLDAAAQFVSDEILASSSVELAADRSVNLRVQLGSRARYHQSLIRFIGSNGLLGRLSQSSRRHLASNAELLHAAIQLWQLQNRRMEERPGASTALAKAVGEAARELGMTNDGEDVLRIFFRTQVARLPTVLQHSTAHLRAIIASQDPLTQKSLAAEEANDVILAVYRSLLGYRQTHLQTYGLENNPCEAWSSQPPLLDVLQAQYDVTLDLVKQRTRELGEGVDRPSAPASVRRNLGDETPARSTELQNELKKQLTDLADFLLHMHVERLDFLRRHEASAGASKALQERYHQARSQAIKGLVDTDRAAHAFKLGEQYRDFRMLVELCHTKVSPPGQTKVYMQRFGESFAQELFQWYIEQGRYKELLDQSPEFSPMLTTWLDSTNYGSISWLQDLTIHRYEHASAVLTREALVNVNLAERKLMLSIGKLCKVAQASSQQLEDDGYLKSINGKLDGVDAQDSLFELCKDSMPPQLKLQSIEAQATAVGIALAPELQQTRPAFAQLFLRLVQSILERRALSSEDLIDFCTLKANHSDQIGHFATALDIFERADEMAAGRAQIALQTIWRRAYLHENWHALRNAPALSDQQISRCLRETALYALIVHANSNGYSAPESMSLAPAQTLFNSSEADVSARFGDQSLGGLSGLMHDYETENATLQTAIERDGLNDYYAEIVRLEEEDRLNAPVESIAMSE